MRAWLTFRAGVVLPSPPEATAEGRGVRMRNGSECSVLYEREGESCLLSLRGDFRLLDNSKPGEVWIRAVGDKEKLIP